MYFALLCTHTLANLSRGTLAFLLSMIFSSRWSQLVDSACFWGSGTICEAHRTAHWSAPFHFSFVWFLTAPLLDLENRAYLLTVINQRWLAVRIDFLGACRTCFRLRISDLLQSLTTYL